MVVFKLQVHTPQGNPLLLIALIFHPSQCCCLYVVLCVCSEQTNLKSDDILTLYLEHMFVPSAWLSWRTLLALPCTALQPLRPGGHQARLPVEGPGQKGKWCVECWLETGRD